MFRLKLLAATAALSLAPAAKSQTPAEHADATVAVLLAKMKACPPNAGAGVPAVNPVPPAVLAAPAPISMPAALPYADLRQRVEAGETVVAAVGVAAPPGAYQVEPIPGKGRGVFRCFLSPDGPVMLRLEPVAASAATGSPWQPARSLLRTTQQDCPNGRCPR